MEMVEHISECFIKPKFEVEGSNQPCHLGPWDRAMLSVHYIQKGLLFSKPCFDYSIEKLLDSLKESLSLTLVHFYPLAGRLTTEVDEDQHKCVVFIDPSKGPGARFIYATLNMSMNDILTPTDVPLVVQSFFDHDRAVNYDGHTRSLLSVQVTELQDGIFIGVSMSHVAVDGTSYWNFWNSWSEIHMARLLNQDLIPTISKPPVHKRWVPDGCDHVLPLPFTHPDEFISRDEAPTLRERIFHFSSKAIANLKAKANKDSNTSKISSFQALSALVWKSIIRANNIPHNEVTNCRLAINNRHRLNPPLPESYFGNSINAMVTTTTVQELFENNLGWVALRINQSVANHNDQTIRDFVEFLIKSSVVYQLRMLFDSKSIMMGSSPRFNMHGNEFGLGKPLAVRSGYANKFVGKVTSYPGYEGGGSIDLEITLPPNSMKILEEDEEFMSFVATEKHN